MAGVDGGRIVGVFVGVAFGGLEVGALLVEVAFNHGDGRWWMASNLGGGQVRPGGEMSRVKSRAPGGERRGEEGGVVESDAAGDGGVVG